MSQVDAVSSRRDPRPEAAAEVRGRDATFLSDSLSRRDLDLPLVLTQEPTTSVLGTSRVEVRSTIGKKLRSPKGSQIEHPRTAPESDNRTHALTTAGKE